MADITIELTEFLSTFRNTKARMLKDTDEIPSLVASLQKCENKLEDNPTKEAARKAFVDATRFRINLFELQAEYVPVIDKAIELTERASGRDFNFIAQGLEIDAVHAIMKIYSTMIKQAKECTENKKSFELFKNTFKNSLTNINELKSDVDTLKSHRGLKSIFMNFLGFIGLLGVGYIVGSIYTGKFPLFQPETKSGVLIDHFIDKTISPSA